MSDDNVRVVRRYVDDMVNDRDVSLLGELFTEDFVNHAAPDATSGTEAMKQFFEMLATAFPDFSCVVEDIFGTGDRVAMRFTFSGTHEGEFMGVPASGARVVMSGIDIARIADGRIAELWGHEDWLGLLHQIGVSIPGGDG